MWLNQSFLINHPLDNSLDSTFISIRDAKPLKLSIDSNSKVEGFNAKLIHQMTIKTDDIEAAGDMIQDLCEFLQIQELESIAYFPEEMKKFHEALIKTNELNSTRANLTTNMADSSNMIKTLVIKAEDSRLLGEM